METITGSAPNGAHPLNGSAANGAEQRGSALTLAQAAEALGLSVDSLRRRMKAGGITGAMSVAPHGGRQLLLSDIDLATLRGSAPNGAHPLNGSAANGAEQRGSAPNGAAPEPVGHEADGWKEALNQARREADTLRAERDTARVEVQAARRQAEEAERGMMTANARIESLRAAWWQWYALANGSWWKRLRGLPKPPAELNTPPLLTGPKG